MHSTSKDSIACLPFGGAWRQVGFDIDGKANDDYFGSSVAMSKDGSTIAVGAPYSTNNKGTNAGQVRVFSFSVLFNTWIQVGSDINGEAGDDLSGYSVAMSSNGTTIAIGAPYNNNSNGTASGQVRVYSFNSTSSSWSQVGSDINGEASGDFFGWSVAMSADGTTIASGAFDNDGNGTSSGHARVYSFTSINKSWAQVGSDIDGEAASDSSGYDVAISADGSMIAIGALNNNNVNGAKAGHVRVYSSFSSPSRRWAQVGLDIDGEAQDDQFGCSVAMSADGKTIAVGACGNDGNGRDSGHVRVLTINVTSGYWVQIGSDIDGEAAFDNSGYDVAISSDGKTIVTSAPGNDGNGARSGNVRVYSINSTSGRWAQVGSDIDGEAASDQSGYSIAMSGDGKTIAIGATRNGLALGYVRVYKYNELPTKAPTKVPSKAPTRSPMKLLTKNPSNTTTKWPTKAPLHIMMPVPVAVPVPINCGIFGWNIFCPRRGKCGFLRRLFNIHGC
jgi:hypothetical protein